VIKPLDPAAYWKLRALCADASAREVAALAARDALAVAHKQQSAALAALGFDPKVATFTLDDDTLTITIPDEKGGP